MKIVNLLDKKFGKLTVVEKLQTRRDGSILWKCVCSCGNEMVASTRHLNRSKNTVKSCGCLKLVKGKDHKDWKGVGEISGYWWAAHIDREFKQKSRSKIAVEIDKEFAWRLFKRQKGLCALTGLQLAIHNKHNKNTASLDRIDSNKGYVKRNVQWVHKDINMMKRTYTQEYFIKMCRLVATGVCPIK